MKKVGVLRFPGTNCDRDIWKSLELKGHQPQWLWHQDRFNPQDFSAFILPGGFSYGDYLRSGALAALSPVMDSLGEAAQKGFPIFGICNGFQILCEAGLLPGVLMRNQGGRFIDQWVDLKIENSSQWHPSHVGQQLRMPIAHADGCYFIQEDGYRRLLDGGQVWLTYVNNPNGSVGDIAGVMNEQRNVVGMMPHPERAMHDWMGGTDGLQFFDWGL